MKTFNIERVDGRPSTLKIENVISPLSGRMVTVVTIFGNLSHDKATDNGMNVINELLQFLDISRPHDYIQLNLASGGGTIFIFNAILRWILSGNPEKMSINLLQAGSSALDLLVKLLINSKPNGLVKELQLSIFDNANILYHSPTVNGIKVKHYSIEDDLDDYKILFTKSEINQGLKTQFVIDDAFEIQKRFQKVINTNGYNARVEVK